MPERDNASRVVAVAEPFLDWNSSSAVKRGETSLSGNAPRVRVGSRGVAWERGRECPFPRNHLALLEDDGCNPSAAQVLLLAENLISVYEDFESVGLRHCHAILCYLTADPRLSRLAIDASKVTNWPGHESRAR
jgi:hypothetical protein